MPNQCTKCGEIYADAAPQLLAGCVCGSKFFYYIRQERLDELNRINNPEIQDTLTELARADKIQIENDIREITGMGEEPDKPVILDLESVRVISPGKFEIDIVNLFSKKRPVIYKLEEGKYIIDLTSTYKKSDEIDKKIRNPEINKEEMEKIKDLKNLLAKKDVKNLSAKKDVEKKKKEKTDEKEKKEEKKIEEKKDGEEKKEEKEEGEEKEEKKRE